MAATASLNVNRLRAAAPAASAVSVRLAAEALVGQIDPALPGWPPQCVLVLRSLRMPVSAPAMAHWHDAATRLHFAARAQALLCDAARDAAWPALDAGLCEASAVLFADESELLACLARDAAAGQLQRWWWHALLGARHPEWTTAFVQRGAATAGAMRLLQAWGCLDRVADLWPADAARPGELAVAAPGGTVLARRLRAGPRAEVHAAGPAPTRVGPASHTQDRVPGLLRKPAGGTRSAEGAATAPQPVAVAPGAPAVPAGHVHGMGPVLDAAGGSMPVASTAREPGRRDARAAATPSEPVPSGEHPVRGPDPVGAVRPTAAQSVSLNRSPSVPVHHAAAVSAGVAAVPVPLPSAARRAHRARATPTHPLALALERALRDFATAPATARGLSGPRQLGADRPAARQRPPGIDGSAVPWPGPPAPASAAAQRPAPVRTGFGGVFFLVNLFIARGWLADFTQAADAGLPLAPWRLLAALALLLVGPALRRDALWPLLLGLDDEPVARAMPRRSWLRRTRLALAAPAGRHLQRLVRSLRHDLAARLGLPAPQAVALLVRHAAQVWVTAGELVVVYSIEQHPVAVRLAGLDRDPGFLPAAGRSLRFVFEP